MRSDAVICASGLTCPPGSRCDDVADRCISDAQLDACAMLAEGDICDVLGLAGTCVTGVCELASCGNGALEVGEVCDDGDRVDGDGCRNDCRSNETCGNGTTDYQAAISEQCDCGDGSLPEPPPGCTTANSDAGGLCRADCRLHCGDGELGADEVCDGTPRPFETCVLWNYDMGGLGCQRCGFDFTTCRHIGWHEVVSGFDMRAIWGSGSDNVLAVGASGERGVVLHFDGQGWTQLVLGEPLVDIDGSNANDVFAVAAPIVGFGSEIWHFDGATWTRTPWPSTVVQSMRAVWSSGAGRAIAVGEIVQIYQYDGSDWSLMDTTAFNGATLNDVWGAAANDVWTVGDNGTVGHFSGGAIWTPVTIPALAGVSLRAIEGIAANDVLIGGGSKLIRWDGAVWLDISPPGLLDIQHIWARNASDIYVVDGTGRVLRRRGTTWTEHIVEPLTSVHGVWGVAGSVYGATSSGVREQTELAWRIAPPSPPDAISVRSLWAAGPDDLYTTTQNGSMGYDVQHWDGQSWSSASFSDPLHDVWGTGGTIFVVGETGTILQGTGLALSPAVSNTAESLFAISGSSSSNVVAVGMSGTIVEYNGATWSLASSPTSATLRDIWSGAGLTIAVGDQGTIVHRTGSVWTVQASPTTADLVGVWGAAPDVVYAVARDGSVLLFNGTVWTLEPPLFGATGFSAIAGTGPDDIFAVGPRAMFHRDANGWAPVRLRAAVASRDWTALTAAPGGVVMLDASGALEQLERE